MNGILNYILMAFTIISFNEILIRFYKTALYLAIEKDNIEIVKLLLTNNKLNINQRNILNIFFFIKFKILFFNVILNHIFFFI